MERCKYGGNAKTYMCSVESCEVCFQGSFKSVPWSANVKDKSINLRQFRRATNKVYLDFVCPECGHEFNMNLFNVSRYKKVCPYCTSKKICEDLNCSRKHPCFANHMMAKFWSPKNSVNPRFVARFENKDYYFDCECGHEICVRLNDIKNERKHCGFCNGDSLCRNDNCEFCFVKSFKSIRRSKYCIDADPRMLMKGSEKKIMFVCEKGHKFESIPWNVTIGKWCPMCPRKSEESLYRLLSSLPYCDVQIEYMRNWCRNPKTGKFYRFDFCMEGDKIIVELDGNQHFKHIPFFKNNIEERMLDDVYKQRCAVSQGFSVFRIPQGEYIDKNYRSFVIEWIKTECYTREPGVYYCNPPNKPNLYDKHIATSETMDLLGLDY